MYFFFNLTLCDVNSHCNGVGKKKSSPQQDLFSEYFHEECYDSTGILLGTLSNNKRHETCFKIMIGRCLCSQDKTLNVSGQCPSKVMQ